MSQPHTAVPPVVSLQAKGATDPDRGHLATGLLVAPSVVLVPSPPGEVLDLAGQFEVLIFPIAPLPGDPLIERIAPAGLTVPYGDGHRRPPLGATIRLARPSRNPLSIRPDAGPTVTGPQLNQALADGRDLWTALVDSHAISPALRRAPAKEVWQRLREAEHAPEARRTGGPSGAGVVDTTSDPARLEQLRGFSPCWLLPWWCRE